MELHIRNVSKTYSNTVTVPSRPALAGIDPNNLLIDWKTDDNLHTVKVQN
jgi:hypothetical protein